VEMLSHWVGERKGAPAPLWGLDGVTVAHRQAKQGVNKRYAKHTDCRGDRTGGRIGEGHRGMLAPGRSGGFPNREPATRRDTAALPRNLRVQKKVTIRIGCKRKLERTDPDSVGRTARGAERSAHRS